MSTSPAKVCSEMNTSSGRWICLFHRENGRLGPENGQSTTRPQEAVVILERENKRYRLAI